MVNLSFPTKKNPNHIKSDGNNQKTRESDVVVAGREKRRIVLSGFPWEGEFKTKEEVENYLAGDKIQCLLCGRSFMVLGKHLKNIHNTDVDKYKKRFGIPWCVGLACSETSQKMSKACKRRIENGELDPLSIRTMRKSFKQKQRPLNGYVKKVAQDNASLGRVAIADKAKRRRVERMARHNVYRCVLYLIRTEKLSIEDACDKVGIPTWWLCEYRKQNPVFNKELISLINETRPAHYRHLKNKYKEKACLYCGNQFGPAVKDTASTWKKRKYCSSICANRGRVANTEQRT